MLLLGVDGGGTKTIAWLAEAVAQAPGKKLGEGKAGPSNPRVVAMKAAQSAILDAVGDTFHSANISPATVDAAVLAIAGSAETDVRLELQSWAEQSKLARRVQFVSDAEPILTIGTAAGWGVALVAGTGSFAFGRNAAGFTAVAGGFGYLLGDEGSGYWIGNQALRAICRTIDGRGPPTQLAAALAAELSTLDARGIKTAIYQSSDPRRRIASFSPLVFRTAAEGDQVAAGIVKEAADELAELVRAVCAPLQFCRTSFPLAFAGGVNVGNQEIRQQTLARLAERGLSPDPVHVVTHPVAGCLQLAAALAQ